MTLTLALPSTSLASTRPVNLVVVSPVPLATILDHHLRRGEDQDRVFGTLLGTRREQTNQIHVSSAFGVPYKAEGKGQVTIDMDHHKSLLDLHLKVNPREIVVGWYATSPKLNSFSALIHNFYSSESSPSPAIHLTLNPNDLTFTAYVAQQIGITPRPDQLTFLPVASEMKVHEQERHGIELLTSNLTKLSNSANSTIATEDLSVPTALGTLYTLLSKVSVMLDSVLEYVRKVKAGEIQGDERVGRALLETVGLVPHASLAAKGQASDTKGFEEEFNSHLADVLMVSYLANLVKTQTEISSRLNLLV